MKKKVWPIVRQNTVNKSSHRWDRQMLKLAHKDFERAIRIMFKGLMEKPFIMRGWLASSAKKQKLQKKIHTEILKLR